MTDRISHKEALACVNGQMSEQQVLKLLAYINQQVESEADTVSRAEHEEADASCLCLSKGAVGHEAGCFKISRIRMGEALGLAEKIGHEWRAKLTALQAEHEAVVNRWSLKLSASEARVAELETERETEWDYAYKVGYCDGTCDAKQMARSLRDKNPHRKPAPSIEAGRVQTSPFQQVAEASVQPTIADRLRAGLPPFTEQPAPGGVERCAEPTFSVVNEALPGELPSSRYSAETIAYASACNLLRVTTDGLGFIRGIKPDYPEPDHTPADPPKPGGVERLHAPLTASGSRVRVVLAESDNHGAVGHIAERGTDPRFAWRVRFDEPQRNEGDVWFASGHLESLDPTPADQPRPDYVTRGELVAVFRAFCFNQMADRLEKARKP